MTIAVAIPATAIAPAGPERTMAWTDSSSELEEDGGEDELIMSPSVQRCRAQLIGLPRRDRASAIAPGGPDIGDDGSDLIVGQPLRERRHAVRHRIACRPRRIAAIEYHPDRIDRRTHLDRLVAGERRIMRRHAQPHRAMTAGALPVVDR